MSAAALALRPLDHRAREVDAVDGEPLRREQQAQGARAAAEIRDVPRWGGQEAQQELAPRGADRGVAQAVVGRLVEGCGLVIPDLDRIACSHENSQALATDMTRAAAREARARRVGPAR